MAPGTFQSQTIAFNT